MRYLEASSQHMDNNIFTMQNDVFLLKCQVAQRHEYTRAKKSLAWKTILTILFSGFSVVASICSTDLLTAISSLLAVALLIFNKYSDMYSKQRKQFAASIQQYIDVTLFASALNINESEWGLILAKTRLAEKISSITNIDTSPMLNWYSDYSSLSNTEQVLRCQQENIRWDYNLHKKYRQFILTVTVGAVALILVSFVIVNPDFVTLVCVISWLAPIIEYAYAIISETQGSIQLLEDLDGLRDEAENVLFDADQDKIIQQLIKLQYAIKERRETGILIPDWFYRRYQKKQQMQENQIAEEVTDMKKRGDSK